MKRRSGSDMQQERLPRMRKAATGRTLARIGLVTLAACALMVLVMQTPRGGLAAARLILAVAGPQMPVEVSVPGLRGNWITGLELRNVAIRHKSGSWVFSADTVRIRHRLTGLPFGSYRVRSLYISGPRLDASVRPDADAAEDPPAAGGMAIRIDRFRVQGGQVSASNGVRASGIEAGGHLTLDPGPSARIDSLRASIRLPGSEDYLDAQLVASFSEGRLDLDTLSIQGTGTRAYGAGHFFARGSSYDADLRLGAAPLVLSDLFQGNPVLDSVAMQLRLSGRGKMLRLQADAAAPGGGRMHLDVEGTPDVDGPVSWSIHRAELAGLHLPGIRTRVTASATGSLAGPSLEEVDGRLALSAPSAEVFGHALAPTMLTAAFDSGRARLGMESGIWEGAVRAAGHARPFDPLPAYSLGGTFSGIDAGAALPSHRSTLAGTFTLEGEGLSARASAELSQSRYNQLDVAGSRLDAALRSDTLEVRTRLAAADGFLAASATVHLADTVHFVLTDAVLRQLDVTGLLGAPTSSEVSGRAHLAGSAAGSGLVAEGHLELDASRIGDFGLEGLSAHASVRDAAARLDVRSLLGPGALEAALVAQGIDTDLPSWSLNGQFRDIDLGPLADGFTSELTGRARVTGRGPGLLGLSMHAAPSMINRQPVDSAQVTGQWQGQNASLQASVQMPSGSIDLALDGVASGDQRSFSLVEGRFTGLDLGKLFDVDGLETRLSGRIASLEVTPGQSLAARGKVVLDSSRINSQAVESGVLDLGVSETGFAAGADLRFEGGGRSVDTLSVTRADTVAAWRLHAMLDKIDLGSLIGQESVAGSYAGEAELSGSGPLSDVLRTVTGRLRMDGTSLRDVSFSRLGADFRIAEGQLRVDTLFTSSNALRLYGSGGIVLDGSGEAVLSLGGALLDAGAIASVAGVAGLETAFEAGDTLWLNVRSNGESLLAAGRLGFTGGRYGDVRVLDVDAGFYGRLNRSSGRLTQGNVFAEVTRLSVPTVSARFAEFEIDWQDSSLTYFAGIDMDPQRNAFLRGFADLENRRVIVQDLSVNLAGDQWHLDQEAAVSLGQGYQVDNLLLVAADQEIAVDGVMDPRGRQSLGLTAYNFRIGSVADLFGYAGLDGTMNGSLLLQGDAASPSINGQLDLELESDGQAVGTLEAEARYEDMRLNIDARLAHTDASTLELRGHIPADLRLNRTGTAPDAGGLELSLAADSFNVGWTEPFLDADLFGAPEGRLTGRIAVTGTSRSPHLNGFAELREGRLALPELGITVSGIDADMQLDGDTVRILQVSGTSGGTFEASGAVGMEDLTLGSVDIAGTFRRFEAMNTAATSAFITGDVRLSGTTAAPMVAGTVRLTSTDISPTEAAATAQEFGAVEFTEADLRMLERYFNIRATGADTTTFDLYEALSADVDVILGEDVWLRSRKNPEMNVLVSGVLHLAKEGYQEEQLSGTVQIAPTRSYVRQFGRRFDIRRGRITFTGSSTAPIVDLQASYAVPQQNNQQDPITILLGITGDLGQAEGLAFTLGSEPVSLDQADIISYIATGRPAADAFQLERPASLVAGGELAQLIAAAAGAGIGLDVVEIQLEGSRGATVTAGKRVSRRLFASVSWPLSFSGKSDAVRAGSTRSNKEVIIEYSINAWLLARLRGNASTTGFSLFYQYAY